MLESLKSHYQVDGAIRRSYNRSLHVDYNLRTFVQRFRLRLQ
jgi:hypothetical protein